MGASAALFVTVKWVCRAWFAPKSQTYEDGDVPKAAKVFGVKPKKILVAPEKAPKEDTKEYSLFVHALHESYHEYMADVTRNNREGKKMAKSIFQQKRPKNKEQPDADTKQTKK